MGWLRQPAQYQGKDSTDFLSEPMLALAQAGMGPGFCANQGRDRGAKASAACRH